MEIFVSHGPRRGGNEINYIGSKHRTINNELRSRSRRRLRRTRSAAADSGECVQSKIQRAGVKKKNGTVAAQSSLPEVKYGCWFEGMGQNRMPIESQGHERYQGPKAEQRQPGPDAANRERTRSAVAVRPNVSQLRPKFFCDAEFQFKMPSPETIPNKKNNVRLGFDRINHETIKNVCLRVICVRPKSVMVRRDEIIPRNGADCWPSIRLYSLLPCVRRVPRPQLLR